MKNHITLTFDDETDDFGNPKVFHISEYKCHFQADADQFTNKIISKDKIRTIEIELLDIDSTIFHEWIMASSSQHGHLKSGNIIVYGHADTYVLREYRFENSICLSLKDSLKQMSDYRIEAQSIRLMFYPNALAINGITVFGTLRTKEKPTVISRVEEKEEKVSIKTNKVQLESVS